MRKALPFAVLASAGLVFTAFFAFEPIADTPLTEVPGTGAAAPKPGTADAAVATKEPGTADAAPTNGPSLATLAATAFNGSNLVLGRVLDRNSAYVRHYVTYTSGALTISGVMNIPTGDGPFPLLVLNHGYIDPAVYTNGRGLKREQDYLARRGFAVLHTDYRGHADSTDDPESEHNLRLGYAEDSVNAVLAVRAAKLPTVDASAVGMLGHSMGGGVTLQVLTAVPDLLDAAVLLAPVSGDARQNFDRWTRTRPAVAEEIVRRYGDPTASPAFWDGVSPIKHLAAVQAPVLLHHGTADDSCPHQWAVDLDAAFAAAGKEMTFHSYPGEPHEFAAAWPTVMDRTADFFDEQLRGK